MDLKATLEALRDDLAELEDENASLSATPVGHRTDYERERDRADTLMAEPLKSTADLMAARETAAKLDGEHAAAPAAMVEAARWPRIPSPGEAVDAGAQAA